MRDVLLALFLLTSFPLIIYRFQVGALVIGFLSFMYPQSNTYGFALTVQWLDIILVLTLAGYFLRQGYKDYRHHPLITASILFYLWVCLTTIFSINSDYSFDPWLKFSKVILLALVVYALLGTQKRLVAFLKVLVLSIGYYGVKGGVFTLMTGGSYYVLGPINSFYGDNNGMALVLSMTLPFMILFFTHAKSIYQRYFSLICSLLTAVAVLGTQSRTGLVSLAVALLYMSWLQKKLTRAILILVSVALTAYYFMPDTWSDRMATTTELETDDSFQSRVDMWRASVKIANDYPILGGGFDVIYMPEVIVRYIPLDVIARAIHSAYFQMIAEHGYVGFVFYLFIVYLTFQTARRLGRQATTVPDLPWMQDLSIAIRASIAAYLVQGITSNIAFFDLFYFIIITTAIADNLLQEQINPKVHKVRNSQAVAATG